MRMTAIAAIAAALLVGTSACTQQAAEQQATEGQATADGLAGTWKADLATSEFEDQPDVYLIKDGKYDCSSCSPPLSVAADGKFHPVPDRPYYDSLAVTIVDDRTVKFERKKGDRDAGSSTWQLSPDGNTLNAEFVDKSTDKAVSGKGTSTRVAATPAGAHAVSGSWKANRLDNLSDEGLTFSYEVEGDTIKSQAGDGTTYEAKVGGPDATVQGDPSGLTVSIARPSPNVLIETFKREGKIVGVSTITVGADGKLTGVYENKVQGSTTRYTAMKQS